MDNFKGGVSRETLQQWKQDLQDLKPEQEGFKKKLQSLLQNVWTIYMPISGYMRRVLEDRYSKEGQEWIKIEDLRGLVEMARDEITRRTTAEGSKSEVEEHIWGLFQAISSKGELETAILTLSYEDVTSKKSTKIKPKDLIAQSL